MQDKLEKKSYTGMFEIFCWSTRIHSMCTPYFFLNFDWLEKKFILTYFYILKNRKFIMIIQQLMLAYKGEKFVIKFHAARTALIHKTCRKSIMGCHFFLSTKSGVKSSMKTLKWLSMPCICDNSWHFDNFFLMETQILSYVMQYVHT